jgi:dCTP diphosphatase
VDELVREIRRFNSEREWERFHTPKNLAMGMSIEAAELMEHFLWLTGEESMSIPPEKREQVRDELADVFIYLINMADKLDIDLESAALEKLKKNEIKYPVHKAKGNAKKYHEL